MNSMLKSKAAVGWSLAYLVVCGILPCVLLMVEYPAPHDKTYMKLYGHMFLYPLFFGWIAVYLVACVYPRVRTLPVMVGKTRIVWGAMSLIAVLAFCIDVSSPNVAPWEVKSERLTNLGLADHFTKRMGRAPSAVQADIDKERAALENYQVLTNLEIKKIENWSPVRYVYFFSFVGQTLALLLVLISAVALMQYRLSKNQESMPQWYKDSLHILTLTAVICTLYTFCRIGFANDKKFFFPEVSNAINSWLVLLLFCGALICLAACWSLWIGENLKNFIPAGLLTGLFALLQFKPEWLMTQLGQHAEFSAYFTVLLVVLLLMFMWVLFALPAEVPE